MIGFLIRRIAQAAVVLLGVSVIVFILLHLLPGGPAKAILGLKASPVQLHAFDQEYGLLKPLPTQYLNWLSQLLHGNLGFSYKQNQSVDSLLAENVPRTLILVGVSTILAILVAIPLGMYQAMRRNRPVDFAVTGLSFVFYSMPTFFLGIVLIIIFSDTLSWLPSTGPTSAAPLLSQLSNLALPVATLTLVNVALFSRYMRSAVVENLVQDYVRTAASKGVSRAGLMFRHVLPNAMLPIITLVGLSLPGILSGALVTEALFNYPGMGLLFWNAALTDDFPVMVGTTMVVGVAVVAGSLLADLLYVAFDPRVRLA